MTKVQILSIFSLLILIAGCSTTKLGTYTREKCTDIPGDAAMKVIEDKCMLCHSGDFPSKEEICSRRGLIIDAVQSGRMPKIGSLTPDQLKALTGWR